MTERRQSDVTVVGCGVSGLTCGIRLLEAQFPVTIVARDLPPHTTSNAAAAIWYPYKAYPIERVLKWGSVAVNEFYHLMAVPDSGVRATTFVELFEHPEPDPWWKDAVRRFRHAAVAELPVGYRDGYVVEVPLIETPVYMQYLLARFRQLGGRIAQRDVTHLSDLYGENRLLVNCAGLGAKEIVGDNEVYPIRGQIVRVKAVGLERSLVDETGRLALTYIVPRSQDCILGGTAEEHNWNRDVDPLTAQEILRKCRQLDPALANVEILDHIVGLRPGRKEVRLEVEAVSSRCAVIHNYGHGGAGFTLSWGCAEEVVELAERTASRMV